MTDFFVVIEQFYILVEIIVIWIYAITLYRAIPLQKKTTVYSSIVYNSQKLKTTNNPNVYQLVKRYTKRGRSLQ